MTDRWNAAIASAAELLRNYAVMIERGEVPPMRAPIALLNVARVMEQVPAPPLEAEQREKLKTCIVKAIGVAVDLHDMDDHALYLMRDIGNGAPPEAEEAAGLIADAILEEIDPQPEIDRLRGWLSYIDGNFRDPRECAAKALRGDPVPEGFTT